VDYYYINIIFLVSLVLAFDIYRLLFVSTLVFFDKCEKVANNSVFKNKKLAVILSTKYK
jgi:hypothetical protein